MTIDDEKELWNDYVALIKQLDSFYAHATDGLRVMSENIFKKRLNEKAGRDTLDFLETCNDEGLTSAIDVFYDKWSSRLKPELNETDTN